MCSALLYYDGFFFSFFLSPWQMSQFEALLCTLIYPYYPLQLYRHCVRMHCPNLVDHSLLARTSPPPRPPNSPRLACHDSCEQKRKMLSLRSAIVSHGRLVKLAAKVLAADHGVTGFEFGGTFRCAVAVLRACLCEHKCQYININIIICRVFPPLLLVTNRRKRCAGDGLHLHPYLMHAECMYPQGTDLSRVFVALSAAPSLCCRGGVILWGLLRRNPLNEGGGRLAAHIKISRARAQFEAYMIF